MSALPGGNVSTQLHDRPHQRSNRPSSVPTAARCRICDRAVHGDLPVCYCCRLSARQLGLPLVPTVVTTEYHVGDQAHARLRGYKDARTAGQRLGHRRALVADLAEWLAVHTDPLAARLGAWSAVIPVPSTRRPGRSPASVLLAGVSEPAQRPIELLGRGRCPPGHLDARREGFVLLPGVERARFRGVPVLVFDDSVTTGARSQSAAATLRLAGFRVVGVLAVGRALPAARPGGMDPPIVDGDHLALPVGD